ncbi:Protein rolling stone [Papilio machaon]|uniref:Protein rolling stone n=1 Tax=Papilio machaon TaxID=76193 RepID=A0A0N0PDH4_PAPMA|nr:Protein rolling stone [Papilio machaon]
MSAIRSYFKEEGQLSMLGLECSKPSCFYLSAWQRNRSTTPLLVWRSLLFLTSLGILLSSMIMYGLKGKLGFWFIYLTHWGLTLNTVATAMSAAVSARCYFYGPIGAEFALPWYVKSYWVFYNSAVPIAFLITVFYWTILYEAGFEEELNHGLDVAVHGLNSLVMFLLLVSASQPSRLLHVCQPVIFGLTYAVFGAVYYFAGGVDTNGNTWIYPVINWAQPGSTMAMVAITGLLLVVLHLAVVGMANIRDAITARVIRRSIITHIEEGIPLRTATNQQTIT